MDKKEEKYALVLVLSVSVSVSPSPRNGTQSLAHAMQVPSH